jgi:histidyl-tRNA synthetase
MQDVLPDSRRYWDMISARAIALARRFGFQRIDVPIIEYTELFSRGAGTGSDVFVQKEMYTINEEDGESITLRPEFTAGFVRAYIENGMGSWPQPVKLYTIGPLFRRERPQAGRFRQHSQFNIEIIGEDDPAADAEIMILALELYRELGYKSLGYQLNSTGCPGCRPAYVERLRAYLAGHEQSLSPVDRERLHRNPLRILDSKEPGMEAVLADAPHIIDHLCADCASHFAELRQILDALQLPYEINFRLVRGFDYYTKTAFEVWDRAIGAQAALCGGGRYDGLAEAIGGPPTPGVGIGVGIERIAIGLQKQNIEAPAPPLPQVLVAHFGGQTKLAAAEVAFELRRAGLGARIAFGRGKRSIKSQLREAGSQGVKYVVIIGENEMAAGEVTVRHMAKGEQITFPRTLLLEWLVGELGRDKRP